MTQLLVGSCRCKQTPDFVGSCGDILRIEYPINPIRIPRSTRARATRAFRAQSARCPSDGMMPFLQRLPFLPLLQKSPPLRIFIRQENFSLNSSLQNFADCPRLYRAALQLLSYSLPTIETRDATEAFAAFDVSGRGALSKSELDRGLKQTVRKGLLPAGAAGAAGGGGSGAYVVVWISILCVGMELVGGTV